jgi:hypothetical protein
MSPILTVGGARSVGRVQPGAASGGGGGDSEPTPSGTIIYDMRAGGGQSLQSATSIANVDTAISAVDGRSAIPDGEQVGSFAFTEDYDGAGKHAIRLDWPQNLAAQSSLTMQLYYPDQYPNIYTSFVIHLGKTATGGGLGSNGAFALGNSTGFKRFMWLRNADNSTDRLYFNWPTGGYNIDRMFISCDNLSLDIPITTDWASMVGVDVRWTFEFIAGSPSTARVWRDGVLVLDDNDAGIGTLGFEQSQVPTTRFNTPSDESEYLTDIVMWTV